MKQTTQTPHLRLTEAAIHVIGWGIIFGVPFLMMTRSGFNITWMDYLRHGCIVPLSFLIVFYVNYLFLIPKYLFEGHTRQYILFNLILIAAITACGHLWQEDFFQIKEVPPERQQHPPGPPRWMFMLRDAFSMVLTAGLSVAIKMSRRWVQSENERREAELKNLRNQLNPHFLLNTLNNIYALITFDKDKAQTAVQELSRLLRHVLYENQQHFVLLDKEIDFIRNYIELMRIRLSANVHVKTSFDIRPNSSIQIAPLIFISLIENAFKHGISPTESSFISIRFREGDGKIFCEIRNSYHPKSQADKSGSGIGLKQVQKRLDLTYPGRYEWQHGIDEKNKEYFSRLSITY